MNKSGAINYFFKLFFIFSFFLAFLFLPLRTGAIWGVTDVVTDPWHTIVNYVSNNWKNYVQEAKEYAAQYFRKQLEDYIADEIIKWINGEGDPKFVSDFEGFLTDVADNAAGKWLEDEIGIELMRSACKPDWAANINIALQKPPRFTTKARCSLGTIVSNIDEFYKDFNAGGWKAWIKVSESQNNPYGLYLMAYDEKMKVEQKKALSAQRDAEAGNGFLSDKVCVTRTCYFVETFFDSSGQGSGVYGDEWTETGRWKKEEAEPIGLEADSYSCTCDKWETRTPGQIALEGLNKTVFKDLEWIQHNERYYSYIVAITDALINRFIKDGVTALTTDNISGKSGSSSDSPQAPDLTDKPPKTSYSVADPWHVKITVDAPGTINGKTETTPPIIYYTLDGSEPSPTPPPVGNSLIYTGPIAMGSKTTLKWIAQGAAYNQENTHLKTFDPPFFDNPLSTILVVVSPSAVAIRANKPAEIYFSLENDPGNFERYIKKIDFSSSRFQSSDYLNWYAVDLGGNKEPVHTIYISPPFPDEQFPRIEDLIYPEAVLSGPISFSRGQYFDMDASDSFDNDNTPKIVMYEWDFEDNGIYDWQTVDWNRDGIFEENICLRESRDCPAVSYPEPGVIKIKHDTSGNKRIRVRITDDEGLSSETSIVVKIN